MVAPNFYFVLLGLSIVAPQPFIIEAYLVMFVKPPSFLMKPILPWEGLPSSSWLLTGAIVLSAIIFEPLSILGVSLFLVMSDFSC
jgi:hypothetical protein